MFRRMRMTAPWVGLIAAGLLGACGETPSAAPPDAGVVLPPGGGGGGGNRDAGSSDGGTSDGGMPEYTWHRDVLPIVQDSCQGCHTAGGIGPFPLTSYSEAEPMHAAMAGAVVSRRMPPWMPDPDCNSYLNEHRLTQAEIETIAGWSAQGAPEGDPAEAPPPPAPPKALGWVDATLDPGYDYTPSAANGPDDYHCFILDPQLAVNRDVIGFDIVPGVRRQVHHVLLYSATRASADARDAQSPDVDGWTCFGGPETSNPSVVGGWVPGTPITEYPTNTGIRLNAGEVLVMQIHYNTSNGAPEADRTQVKLQYSAQPVGKPAYILPQADSSFAIPPGAMGYSTTDTAAATPIPVVLYGVLPHMHTLGRKIRVELSPSGQCLVDIPQWDFHWQQFYMLQEPLTVPAGQSTVLTCTWDNPTASTVTWGEGTSDEMCLNYVYVTLP